MNMYDKRKLQNSEMKQGKLPSLNPLVQTLVLADGTLATVPTFEYVKSLERSIQDLTRRLEALQEEGKKQKNAAARTRGVVDHIQRKIRGMPQT